MELSYQIKCIAERKAENIKLSELKNISGIISARYQNESGRGRHLVTKDMEALVYSIVRMPATFAAMSKSLEYALEALESSETIEATETIESTEGSHLLDIDTVLDVGAGVGTSIYATRELLNPRHITCLEREESMRKLGMEIYEEASREARDEATAAECSVEYIDCDINASSIPYSADLVIASYSLNELDSVTRERVIDNLWEATGKMLLIVETGTPAGTSVITEVKRRLLGRGAHILAPCTSDSECKLSSEDWCHFAVRVPRSKLHRMLKEGEAPYEDEKYAYVALIKEQEQKSSYARVLRHPFTSKNTIDAVLCTEDGIRNIKARKKDTTYKALKKASWGDRINL